MKFVGMASSRLFVWLPHAHERESRDRLTLPGRTARLDLNWSPDGHFFAYVDAYNPNSDVGRLWLLKLEDGRRPFHEVGLSARGLPRRVHIHWVVHAISRPACSDSIRCADASSS